MHKNFNFFQLWKDACGQVFLSLLASSGGLLTWSSYNRFYNKYYIDAAMMILIVPLLAIFSAIPVFAVAGHLSHVGGLEFTNAFSETEGPIVPLVAYSHALSKMWGDVLPWSIVIFGTLFFSSTTAMVSAVISKCCIDCHLYFCSQTTFFGLGH